jgi:ABC-type antimicrobial peptide transport system permease subunit
VALGAQRKQIVGSAIGRPFGLLISGSIVGLVAGLSASQLLGRIVYEADPRDPLVVGGAIATMVLLGLMATLIPARRALTVDPSRLMREE